MDRALKNARKREMKRIRAQIGLDPPEVLQKKVEQVARWMLDCNKCVFHTGMNQLSCLSEVTPV